MILPRETSLGKLEIIEVYDVFDFPRLFTCRNRAGQLYLAVSVNDTTNSNTFLYAPVSPARYRFLLAGRFSIHDIFTSAEDGYVYRVDIGPKTDFVEHLACADIPEQWLVAQNEYIENSQARVKDEGVESAAVIAHATRRESTNFSLKLPKNSTQIAPRILGHFLTSFQELVDAIGQSCAGAPTLKGAIPKGILDQTGFLVMRTYASSFGVQFVADERDDLLEDSLAGDALERLFALVNAEADEQQLRDLLHSLKGRATTKYRAFLEALIESEGDLNIQWGSPIPGRGGTYSMSRAVMESVHRIVSVMEQQIGEEVRVFGSLVGLNIRTRSYEILGIHDNKKYAGKVAEGAPDTIYHAVLSKSYVAVLKRVVEVQATSGEERERWLLVDLLSADDEDLT